MLFGEGVHGNVGKINNSKSCDPGVFINPLNNYWPIEKFHPAKFGDIANCFLDFIFIRNKGIIAIEGVNYNVVAAFVFLNGRHLNTNDRQLQFLGKFDAMSIDGNKLLVICGPTGVGKTALAVRLAKNFGGEIVSADSRQAYKKLNIATGKDLSSLEGVPIHLVDVVDPDQTFTVAHYYRLASEAIDKICGKDRLPIIVGGTGLYIKAIVDGIDTLGIPPNKRLREQYQSKSAEELLMILARVDPEVANSLNKSEQYNKQRLVRRIEIAQTENSTSPDGTRFACRTSGMNTFFIGLTAPNDVLRKNINKRIDKWIKEGAEEEVRTLLDQGVSWDSQAMSALGYRQWQPFFENKKSREEVINEWKTEEFQYAKRQLTWFKKNKRIVWCDVSRVECQDKVEKQVQKWYYNN